MIHNDVSLHMILIIIVKSFLFHTNINCTNFPSYIHHRRTILKPI